MSVCVSPTLFNKVFATLKWVCWKIGNIIFKCNLFRIFWSRSVGFIYSYSSLYSYPLIPQEKNFKPTRKMLDPRNTYKIKFWTQEKKCRTHEIPTKTNFGPKKYPREKILDPWNTHEKSFRTHEGTVAPWHETHDGTRPTELAHSIIFLRASIVYANKTHTN